MPRYAFFAMPHIAIDANGEVGVCHRAGQSQASSACGALVSFRSEMLGGRLSLELDPDDVVQSLLKQRLFRQVPYGDIPDLVGLTRMAHDAVLEDLERMITLTVNPGMSYYAVLTGVLIHGPKGANYVWPGSFYAVIDQRRHDLEIERPPGTAPLTVGALSDGQPTRLETPEPTDPVDVDTQ